MYDWNAPAMQGITLEKLKDVGWMRLNVGAPGERAPHAEGNFKTPSGKCEFKASAAANGNFIVPVWRNGYNEMQPGDPVDPRWTAFRPSRAGMRCSPNAIRSA